MAGGEVPNRGGRQAAEGGAGQLLTRAALSPLLERLIAIPSVNPSLTTTGETSAAAETAVAEFARDWLIEHGVEAWLEEPAPGRPNVVARVAGGGGDQAKTLVLCAHTDTVGTTGMTIAPFVAQVMGDSVYGRGAYDMKGSVAAILVAMAELRRRPPAGTVLAALVADEEYASLGAFDFVGRHRADACIVTEPSDAGGLVLAHKGFVWAKITTAGRAAHGSRFDLGVSAIARMGRIIAALDEFDRGQLRRRRHPLVGAASLHCALVSGGSELSTYAAQCALEVERRTLPGETAEQVVAELEAVIAGAGEEARVELRLAREPLSGDAGSRIANSVRQAVVEVTGRPPEDAGVGFWMDAAVFGAAGIETVNYGPTGAGAHAAVEWVDLPSVVRLAQVLVAAAHAYCEGAAKDA